MVLLPDFLRRLKPPPSLAVALPLGERKRSGVRVASWGRGRGAGHTPPCRRHAAVALEWIGIWSEETEWEREPMGQRESARVSVIWGEWLCFIGPSKYSYLQLNQSPFSGYLRLTAAISVSIT